MPESIQLSAKQQRAIALLSTGMTGQQVAKNIGVTPKTISTWRNDHKFGTYLAKEQISQIRELKRLLSAAGEAAVKAIVDIMISCENPNVRLKAATVIIDRVFSQHTSDKQISTWLIDPSDVEQLSAELDESVSTGAK